MVTPLPAVLLAATLASAAPPPPGAGALKAAIDRLQVTTRVLYVAAHPDDENTRLLAWLVGERGVDARYLSMTRGGGGQNLIGTEQAELLGLVRTLELLAARALDGAGQWFTGARDFGYSKTPEETLRIWGRDRSLADVVRVIRRFQPDVLVTRFTDQGPNHGHHTASAILAAEAFTAAADPARFPELGLPPWQAERLVYNVSTWRLPKDADMSAYLAVDVGGYSPLLGASWGEVAAASRTMHKSQGFGSAPQRGPLLEYFQPLQGSPPDGDLLSGLTPGWDRFPGTERLREHLAEASRRFDPAAPHLVIPALAGAWRELSRQPPSPRRDDKLAELREVIAAAAGLWLAARGDVPAVTPGQALGLRLEALNRSPARVELLSVALHGGRVLDVGEALTPARPFERTLGEGGDGVGYVVAPSTPLAVPHWLARPPEEGWYHADDPARACEPDTPAALTVRFRVRVEGLELELERPILHAEVDRVRGEVLERVEVVPAVTATPAEEALVFPEGRASRLAVTLRAGRDDVAGALRLEVPDGWKVTPREVPFTLARRGDEQVATLEIRPPAGAGPVAARVVARVGTEELSWRLDTVDYEHIPRRSVLRPAEVRLVPLAIRGTDRRVGYLPGSGDKVAEGLAQAGFDVTTLDPARLTAADLKGLDAVVLGVRAYNVEPRLRHLNETLWAWVARGGRLVVQYNTHSTWSPLDVPVAPFALAIGRGRVTDETAPLEALDPRDPLLTSPNRLTAADFEGWVQERGLYFAESWDPRFRPVLRTADPGEPPEEGSLLVAKHGRGEIIYTGLAFFRQLPAGVPGAYRLLANLLSHGR